MHLILFVFHEERVLQHAQFPKIAATVGIGQGEPHTFLGHRALDVEHSFVIHDVANVMPSAIEKKEFEKLAFDGKAMMSETHG